MWAGVPLSQVSHGGVSEWVGWLLEEGLSASSARQAFRVLSLILSAAVKDRRLAVNPAEGVRLPRPARPEKRFLTHDQVESLAEACGRYRLVVYVLGYCGLRWGELAALKVCRVDLLSRRLIVAEAVSDVRGIIVSGTPKTHQQRSVPLPRFLIAELDAAIHGKGRNDLVFTSPHGLVLRNHTFRRNFFDSAAVSVGLPGLTPHELRHTAASLAVAAGANVKAVQRMLGHASAAMTLDVYSGLFEDDLDALADQIDAARARADSLRTAAVAGERSGRSSRARDARNPGTAIWWGGWDSNPRPRDYESPALTG